MFRSGGGFNLKTIELLIEEEVERAIQLKSPETMPLNPTAQGWSGAEVRSRLTKFILDKNDSVLSVMKEKLVMIKDNFIEFEVLFEDTRIAVLEIAKKELDNLIHLGEEPPQQEQAVGSYWIKITGTVE